jgi:hypothetical protein
VGESRNKGKEVLAAILDDVIVRGRRSFVCRKFIGLMPLVLLAFVIMLIFPRHSVPTGSYDVFYVVCGPAGIEVRRRTPELTTIRGSVLGAIYAGTQYRPELTLLGRAVVVWRRDEVVIEFNYGDLCAGIPVGPAVEARLANSIPAAIQLGTMAPGAKKVVVRRDIRWPSVAFAFMLAPLFTYSAIHIFSLVRVLFRAVKTGPLVCLRCGHALHESVCLECGIRWD